MKRAAFADIGAFLAPPWAGLKRPLRRDADFQWAPDRDVQCPAAAEILVAARHRVSVGRWAWIDPVLPQGAFLEEPPVGPDQQLDQDERGGIVQVVLLAVDLRASVRSERQSKELKRPPPDASRRAQMAVPEPFQEW